MPAKIPATIVTGFLGAGKTTLIRHLIGASEGLRIALIVNEFGDLGVDGEILKGCGVEGCSDEDVVELSNGCICCAVAEDFLPALRKLIVKEPDHIVIETSGLALPQPLVRAFGWPEVNTRVTVDGVIAVVDAPAVEAGTFADDVEAVDRQRAADEGLDHETPLADLFRDQIACADMILVNKADLAKDVDTLTAEIGAAARGSVSVVAVNHGVVDPKILLGIGVGAENDMKGRHGQGHGHGDGHEHHHHDHDHDQDHDHDHDHDAFDSFVVELPEIADPEALERAVADAVARHRLLRVKGFAAVTDKPMRRVLQAVGPRVDGHYDRPFAPGEARGTRLVVIGRSGLDQSAVIGDLKDALAGVPA